MTDRELTWDLSPLYTSDDDPRIEQDLLSSTQAYRAFADKWQKETALLDEKQLRIALEEWEGLASEHGFDGKPGYYFSLRSSQDVTSPQIRARLTLVANTAKVNADATRFFPLLICQATPSQQKSLLASQELVHFRPYLRRLFDESAHNLTEGEERVFSYLIDPAYDKWTEMIEGFLGKEEADVTNDEGQVVRCGYSDLDQYLTSANQLTRQSAVRAVDEILSSHAAAAENELNAILETKKASDYLRGYQQPEDERLLSDMIDSSVVGAMVAAVTNKFDISARFYRLKAHLLKLPTLTYGERNVTFGTLPNNYTFQSACEIVQRSLTELDSDFSAIFSGFIKNGQIDVFPRSGKRSGAFCAYNRIDLPTYILLNHTNNLRDLTTLAHEVGHGINDELIKKTQTALYASTPLSTAEVASTFMEDFALAEAAGELSGEARLSLLVSKLNDDIATIFRQVAAFNFEFELHREYRLRGYLSKEDIGELFQKHMSAYLGESIDFNDQARNWWIGWHHFRRPFYVYSYASGLLISKSLQEKTRRDPSFINLVKEFLSTGTSAEPAQIFAKLGINIGDNEFWQEGIGSVEKMLKEAEVLAGL